MAAESEHSDEVDIEQLARLLTSAYDAPPMRGEFVSALSQRLDVEFARTGATAGANLPAPSRNGKAPALHAETAVAAADSIETAAEPAAPAPRRSRRRWTVALATAAALLLAAAILSDPPAFAAALRALVTTISELTTGRRHGNDAQTTANSEPPTVKEHVDVVVEPRVSPPAEAVEVEVHAPAAASGKEIESAAKPEPTTGAAHPFADEPGWEPFANALPVEELSQRIDEQLAALWQANGIRPVDPATDAEFARRVHLDLVGRIPSVSEVQQFLENPSPDRRERLVDRLLAHHDHATHLAAVWRGILLPAGADLSRLGGPDKFDEWLAERFAANMPYDQLVRELLLAEGRVSESGPLLFYAALKLNPEELAARTSRAFLGVRMECAQCHDHPFDELSQQDFWSFAAFFARISRPRGKMEMASPVLAVRDNQHGEVTLPDSDEVVPPRLPLTADVFEDAPDGPPRREQLARWLTSPHNGQFARATVNRVWAQLFGRGLVEPVDDMRPANPPIAPEVLDTLSRDFAASGFDLRRLLSGLVLSRTYQLSSRSEDGDPSRALHFAQMNVKSLTADQLYDCISVATRQGAMAEGPANLPGLQRFGDTSRRAFIEKFRAPAGQVTDYQAGIPQALTLMHGGLIHSATDVASSGLLNSLEAPFFTDQQRLDTLFLSTLSRYPTDAERSLMLRPIQAASSHAERQQALGDVLWALLNSAEFTFNH